MTAPDALARSPLANPAALPLRPATAVAGFGPTLVIAPHPDDESLGCGGAIALLRRIGCAVRVLFVSDGTLSHPASRRFPAPALRALREREALAALGELGVDPVAAAFLRLKDRAVPLPGADGFEGALARCRAHLATITPAPATILLPWRRDPHPDHRASWQLVQAAIAGLDPPPRLVEYPIWIWELAERDDAPAWDEVTAWRLDVGAVLPHKLAAIASHRSQTTDLIDDDPEGFRLTPEILAHFGHPWETYLEARG